ncbi:hypothetical protein Bca101_088470 [Brassica carinata]
MKLLNKRNLKGTFFGNYKPKTDIPGVVKKYMNKELELEKFSLTQYHFLRSTRVCLHVEERKHPLHHHHGCLKPTFSYQ